MGNASESKMIFSVNMVSKPELIKEINNKYQIIYDQSLADNKYDNLNRAICLMAENGWRCVNITTVSNTRGLNASHMYALMEKL